MKKKLNHYKGHVMKMLNAQIDLVCEIVNGELYYDDEITPMAADFNAHNCSYKIVSESGGSGCWPEVIISGPHDDVIKLLNSWGFFNGDFTVL